jgi:hypothetical protein
VGVRAGDGKYLIMLHFLTRYRKQIALLLGYQRYSVNDFEEYEKNRKPKGEEGWKEGYTNTELIIDTKE